MSVEADGSITILFTDIEGSTRLVQRAGADYPELLTTHRRLLGEAFRAAGGRLAQTVADECIGVFSEPRKAVAAAAAAQRAVRDHPWPAGREIRIRMAVHTGRPALAGDEFIGLDVHRAARICDAGHGGQVLVSNVTRALVGEQLPPGASWRSLGSYALKDLPDAERLHQLVMAGARNDFPALRAGENAPPEKPGRRRIERGPVARAVRGALGAIRREQGFAAFASRIRDLADGAPPHHRAELERLQAEVLEAGRAFTLADEYAAAVDRESVARRLEAEPSTARKGQLREQLDAIDRLVDLRRVAASQLDALWAELSDGGADRAVAERLASNRLRTLASRIEKAYAAAPKDAVFRLRRTWRRGVYRQGNLFVVPYIDDLGIDRRKPFGTPREAGAFARALRAAAGEPTEFAAQSFSGVGLGPGGHGERR